MKNSNRSSLFKQSRTTLLASMLVFGAGLAAAVTSTGTCSSGCDEAASDVNATLLSNPDKVSLSRTGSTTSRISYSINITHYANTEPLTSTQLTLTTSVTGAAAGTTAAFDATALPSGCTLSNATTLVCGLPNTTNSGDSLANFSVTVIAPTSGTQVSLASTLSYYEEGHTEVIGFPAVDTALSDPASDPDFAGTFIPPAGGTFFTGTNGGLPSAASNATWAATIKVPSNASGVGGTVQNGINSDPACPRAANLLDCSSSEIQVPGLFTNQLTFVLRRDGSTIRGNGKIDSAIVYYDHPDPTFADGRINYLGYGFQVPSCGDRTYGTLPLPGIPCILHRNSVFKFKNGDLKTVKDGSNGNDDAQNSGKLLYWEFIIQAVDNGRFTN